MGPRQKRQKLAADGAEAAVITNVEVDLAHHTKAKDSATEPEKQSTLYVRSLSVETTKQQLAEHFSQSFPLKHAIVVTDKDTGKCKGYGFVTFVDHEDARRALAEFHNTDFMGKKLNVTIAERRQREEGGGAAASAPRHTAADGRSVKEAPQSSKLIVRNLPWSVDTAEKLIVLFRSFGKINQAIVPKDPQGRMKGFGIVMLRGRKNAELALERLNGKEMDGRTLAVDWAADKDVWVKAQEAAKEAEKQVVQEVHQAKHGRVDSGQSEDDDEDEDNDEEDGGVDLESEKIEDADEDEEDEEELENEDDDDEDDEESKPKTTSNESVLFIRNLPFTTTDEGLYEHFGALYPVRYARIVLDRATERPRGTGFVCFYKKEDADTVLKESPRYAAPTKEDLKNKKKGRQEKSGPSILENELSDPTGRYTLDGRVLSITRAVDRNEAERLTTEGTENRNKRDRDKRRLYLLGEGTIPSNSPLYEKLSPSEQAMREASAKQRRKLIDSNPSLNISLTRLSIRNIPRSITTTDLKDLARKAVVGFATDVKEERRTRLSKEELARDTPEMHAADKERRVKKKGIVKQAKIIFEGSEGSKVDEASGRSRGYGFIEYWTHRSALMGLRWLNGQGIDYQTTEKKKGKVSREEIQERKKRLIVEFAIENAQVVKRRADREQREKDRPKIRKGDAKDGEVIESHLERSVDKKRKRGETKRTGDEKRALGNGRVAGRMQSQEGAAGAARRVADKAKRLETTAGEGRVVDEKEKKDKNEIRRVIAKKRRDRKVERRLGRGKV